MTIETEIEFVPEDSLTTVSITFLGTTGPLVTNIRLSRQEVEQLKNDLDSWLKTPTTTLKIVNCNDRSAHKPHIEKGGYCSGRAFDIT